MNIDIKSWGRRLLPLFIVGAAILLFLWATVEVRHDEGDAAVLPLFTVKKGPLAITVREAGTIKAREQIIIKNEVTGRTSILWLIEEGKKVKEGDLLIELDASELEDQLVDEQIKVQNAEAAWIRVRENLDVVRNQAQSDVEKAEIDLLFAEQDLEKYNKGEYPKDLKEAEAKITLAREELRRAEEKLQWSKVLFEEQYISQVELQADELATHKAKLDLELREAELDLLKKFTHSRKLTELESKLNQAEMALDRTRRKANADVVQAEAELRAKRSEYDREKGRLEKIEEQIIKTKIHAPADGLVIYATTAQGTWRGNAEPLAAGQEVKERQELIYLPKTTSVLAEIKLHESSLDKVKEALPTTVTVDALPGRVFKGVVASISPLPDAQSMWLNPDLKLYTTIIHLEGDGSDMRTGMSCMAEILIEKFDETLFAPLQSVQRKEGEMIVYMKKGPRASRLDDFRPVPVKLGLDNNSMVQILDGLNEGDTILLAPPLPRGPAPRP